MLGLLVLVAIPACTDPAKVRPHESLSAGAEPLRTQFSRDAGHPRLLMILAPTWAQCLRGASEVQNGVLARESDGALRVYVVWVPMFRGMERDVPKATTEVPDPRARHYWDGDSLLVTGYQATLRLPEAAWDVFLLYDREARWDGEQPPEPVYWMHQLGSRSRPRVDGPYLDAAVLLDRTRQLLAPAPRTRLPAARTIRAGAVGPEAAGWRGAAAGAP